VSGSNIPSFAAAHFPGSELVRCEAFDSGRHDAS
jgi:hypothetical protein